MAYTVDILEALKNAENGLLSKIKIGNKTYEIKDLIARENIETLGAGLDAIIADLQNYQTKALAKSEHDALVAAYQAADKAIEDAYKAADAETLNSAKAYADAVAATINKFDVAVVDALPAETPSAENMYILYLVPKAGSTGSYVEYIAIRSGEEGAYTYAWEQIGSTAMDLTGFVTEDALNDILEDYHLKEEAHQEHAALEAAYKAADAKVVEDVTAAYEAADKAITDSLGKLAKKDSATGTVAGQDFTGIKATGTGVTGVTLTDNAVEKDLTAAGNFTPAGEVSGSVTVPGHDVPVTVTNNEAQATVSKGTATASANVSITPATQEVVGSFTPGTLPSFVEGKFTAATLTSEEVTANYVDQAIVGSVDGETLTFTEVATKALAATKVNSFDGGSKAADTWNAGSECSVTKATVVNGITEASVNIEYEKVTGVAYQKAEENATGKCAGAEVAINATFAGTPGAVSVAGKYTDTNYSAAANTGAIELAVDNFSVTEKTVVVE